MRAGRLCYGAIAAFSTPPGTRRPPDARRRRVAWTAAAALLAGCFLAQALWQVAGQDATYDERHTFGTGARILSGGGFSGAALLHPPLGFYVSGLPLLALARAPAADDAHALLLGRVTSLLVFAVPLLLAVALWARALFGPAAALTAVALAAFSPTLLAHAPLITPDLPLTATGFVAVWLFWRRADGRQALGWGIALGLALLTKVTALLFVGVIVVLALVRARGGARATLRTLAPGLAAAWLVLNLGYGFTGLLDWTGKAALVERIPFRAARAAAWVAAPFVPLPYLHTVGRQSHVALSGWPNYLLGEISTDGWPHYYLVAVAVKETLPFLVLMVAAAASLRLARRGWDDELALLLPPILFFVVFSLGRVQIGIRYLLPAFPFLCVFASRLAELPGAVGRPMRAAVALLLVAHAASTLRTGPDHLAYFNELAGGPANGYRYLADSNLDWGQNRTRAQEWARAHGAAFEPATLPEEGLVVVGVNRLLGLTDPGRYQRLRDGYAPVGRVGANWLVFDLGHRPR